MVERSVLVLITEILFKNRRAYLNNRSHLLAVTFSLSCHSGPPVRITVVTPQCVVAQEERLQVQKMRVQIVLPHLLLGGPGNVTAFWARFLL